MELTLLGTGTPNPSSVRAGPSQHIKIGDASVLVDCGSGVCRRLLEGGTSAKDIDILFVTHMHSDHTIDLAHLLIEGWRMYRTKPIKIIGPAETKNFVERLIHAFEVDINLRHLEERVGSELMKIEVVEVGHGDTYEGDGWKATVIEVEHGYVKPALGFVFEEDNKKLVISGDTTPCRALIDASKGSDLLVHELSQARPDGDPHLIDMEKVPALRRRIMESHTCPHGVGPVAEEADVAKLILSHLPIDPDEDWVRETIGATYKREVVIGHDLLRVKV
jgi:ribonuclease Z